MNLINALVDLDKVVDCCTLLHPRRLELEIQSVLSCRVLYDVVSEIHVACSIDYQLAL